MEPHAELLIAALAAPLLLLATCTWPVLFDLIYHHDSLFSISDIDINSHNDNDNGAIPYKLSPRTVPFPFVL